MVAGGTVTITQLLTRLAETSGIRDSLRVVGDVHAEVADITNDSRNVRRGSLYCCVRGEQHDGHDYAAQAVQSGATVLLVERELASVGVPQIVTGDSRETMGHLASAFFGHPSTALTVVGVTGTNGKTTTAHMLGSILEQSGKRTTVLGTLSGARTTPEAPELQRTLATEHTKGTKAVVMEVSSHALALKRVAGMRFAAATFTNLGHDHLDFHKTYDAYFLAKASLFARHYADRGIVNRDDAYGRKIAEASDLSVVTYGRNDATDVRVTAEGSEFTWRGTRLQCTVGGEFNVMNAIAAATTAAELGVSKENIAAGLATLPRVPGRFEHVNRGGEFVVLVDYAHTPEALRTVIAAAREVAAGRRVHVVFGCGGDRDASKRAEMGAASCLADAVVVTSDNPRNENPQAIVDAIVSGVPADERRKLTVEVDRRRAIEHACANAEPGDVVVIAGRGHETMQSVAGKDVPFNDADVARSVLGVAR